MKERKRAATSLVSFPRGVSVRLCFHRDPMTLVLCPKRLWFAAAAPQHVLIFLMVDVGEAFVNDMIGVAGGSQEVARLPIDSGFHS